jgi:hypothetical protein
MIPVTQFSCEELAPHEPKPAKSPWSAHAAHAKTYIVADTHPAGNRFAAVGMA